MTSTALAEALLKLRKAAQETRHHTDSREYRQANRNKNAAELASNVLDILDWIKDDSDATRAAEMIQRTIANELEQATRNGINLATNAANAIKP